jgi:hypothetical protein
VTNPIGKEAEVKYVGVDWAYREAQWCALSAGGELAGEGRIAADRDGLARLVACELHLRLVFILSILLSMLKLWNHR